MVIVRQSLRVLACVVALSSALSTTARADDMEMLFGQKAKPFIDPAGFYAVVFPHGFDCEARPRRVECHGNRGGQAKLVVDVVDTPVSATPELVVLNEVERFKKQPHFQLLKQANAKIDGSPAIYAAYSYDYLGNVEYPVGVKAMYLVRPTKTYIIHFECPLGAFRDYAKDLDLVYASFRPARLDAAGNPILEDLKPQKLDTTNGALPDVGRSLKSGY